MPSPPPALSPLIFSIILCFPLISEALLSNSLTVRKFCKSLLIYEFNSAA